MHRLTSLLSIRQVYTSGFRPRMNGATERVHRFLNSAIGIFCEKNQDRWEDFLQPAVYAHNTAPISGTSDITPFFLVFGRHSPSPETISLDLPLQSLPADHYAHHLVAGMQQAHDNANCTTTLRAIYTCQMANSFTCARSPLPPKAAKNLAFCATSMALSSSQAIHMVARIF